MTQEEFQRERRPNLVQESEEESSFGRRGEFSICPAGNRRIRFVNMMTGTFQVYRWYLTKGMVNPRYFQSGKVRMLNEENSCIVPTSTIHGGFYGTFIIEFDQDGNEVTLAVSDDP